MAQIKLFEAALGIAEPWQVSDATFAPDQGRLDIYLDFPRGTRFTCPEGDEDACPVHDTESKTWRHLRTSSSIRPTCMPASLGSYVRCMEHPAG
jgi:hypothetical protein